MVIFAKTVSDFPRTAAARTTGMAPDIEKSGCSLYSQGQNKLSDHDTQRMAEANSGGISREEAEARMTNKY